MSHRMNGPCAILQHLKNVTFNTCLNERGKYQKSKWSSEYNQISLVVWGHVTTRTTHGKLGALGFQMRFLITFTGELYLTFSKLFKAHVQLCTSQYSLHNMPNKVIAQTVSDPWIIDH